VVIFIDTSALAKRYVTEAGSDMVDGYFVEDNTIHLAPTTPIEIRSVFTRRQRERSLSEETVRMALEEWMKEEPVFQIEAFDDSLRSDAIEVIERTGIKTLDAIQLASARLSEATVFLTSDKALGVAAASIFSGQVLII
jgi:predicted nucleic acid-binding protein